MKVKAIIETFFELDYADGTQDLTVFYRKNDDHLLMMVNRRGIPVIITNAEIETNDEDGTVEMRLYEADPERNPIVNTTDSSIIVDVSVYKKVL